MRDLSAKVFLAFSRVAPHPVHGFLNWLATERQIGPSPRVLDVGTGPGRLYPMFKDLGWTVVGMEPDPEYYPAASDAALTAGMPPARRGGFHEITETDTYGIVTAINDPVSHLLTQEARLDAFSRVLRALMRGGAFVFDVPNFKWILTHYRVPVPRVAALEGGTAELMRHHEIDPDAGLFTTHEVATIYQEEGATHYSKRIPYAMASESDLTEALRSAGFVNLRTFNGYDSRQSEAITGSRIVMCAQRP